MKNKGKVKIFGNTCDRLLSSNEPYFAVSVHPNRASIPKKVEDFTAEDLRKFLIDNSDLLIREDRNLGGWIENSEVYLDVSKLFKNRHR